MLWEASWGQHAQAVRHLNAGPASFSPALCYNLFHRQTIETPMEYPIILEQDPEAGGYVVYCPTLKGCVSQGETEEEALENIKDAIRTYLESIEDLAITSSNPAP